MRGNAELLSRVQAVRRRLSAEGLAFVRSGGDFERVSIPWSDGDVLRDLMLAGKAERDGVATAARYFEVNAGWRREPTGSNPRLWAYRLPGSRIDAGFEDFRPFELRAES